MDNTPILPNCNVEEHQMFIFNTEMDWKGEQRLNSVECELHFLIQVTQHSQVPSYLNLQALEKKNIKTTINQINTCLYVERKRRNNNKCAIRKKQLKPFVNLTSYTINQSESLIFNDLVVFSSSQSSKQPIRFLKISLTSRFCLG